MSTYPIHTKTLTRSTTRPVTRLAVGAAVHGSVPGHGTPVISIVGGGDLLPGVTIASDTSLPWLADGVQIAPASPSLELPWTVAPGAVITQPGSNALTVAGYHADAANYLNRVAIEDDEPLEQPVQWVWDVFFRQMTDTDHPTPTAASHKIALQAGTAIPMIGARTLAGALVPLYSGMPTPVNSGLVTGDYDRVLGIQYDGATKYIDLGVRSGDLPRDDVSQGVHITVEATSGIRAMIGYGGTGITGSTRIARHSSVSTTAVPRSRSADHNNAEGRMSVGMVATSRSQDDEYDIYGDGGTSTLSRTSQSSASGVPVLVGASGTADGAIDHSDHRSTVAWHCRALDLAYMDTCLTTLQSSIAAALA